MKLIATILGVICFGIINSQDNKNVQKVIYEHSITMDHGTNTWEYTMLFDNHSSFYENIEGNETEFVEEIKENEEGDVREVKTIIGRKKGDRRFFYNRSNIDFYNQTIINGKHIFLVKEEGNKIDWKITEDFKNINNFKCQKAIGKFRGREYTAWFTSEIPVSFGPWKLNGLPGLILEAYDSENMIYLVAKVLSTEKSNVLADKINSIDFGSVISLKEFLKKEEEFVQDWINQINAQLPKGSTPAKFDKNCKDCQTLLEIFEE